MSPLNWDIHITGYKEAGDLLLQNCLEGGRQNVLVYPIFFLYRHYIELQLKEIIINGRLYLEERKRFPRGHNINRLWEECRRVVQEIDTSVEPNPPEQLTRESNTVYDSLGNDINVLGQLDPSSATFRYPTDVDGNPITIDFAAIHLRQLPGLIERIDYNLGGIATGVYQVCCDREEWLSYSE